MYRLLWCLDLFLDYADIVPHCCCRLTWCLWLCLCLPAPHMAERVWVQVWVRGLERGLERGLAQGLARVSEPALGRWFVRRSFPRSSS